VNKWTNFLATMTVAGALALCPTTARAQGLNQFANVGPISGTGGGQNVQSVGAVNVGSFSFIPGDPQQRVFATGSFSDGVSPASAESWLVTITATPIQFTLTFTPQPGSGTTDPSTITFTTGVSAAQTQLVNAIYFDSLRPPSAIREWYMLTLLRGVYP
jgi:hypothetical protein